MDFKQNIKTRRLELGLTLEEVGNIVGVSKTTIQRWESGVIENQRRDKLELLAVALQTTPGELLGWDENLPIKTDEEKLDSHLMSQLTQLTPDELEKVDAFVQGLLAARQV